MLNTLTVLLALGACALAMADAPASQPSTAPRQPVACVTVRVVGEDGKPIPDATVSVGFDIGMRPGEGWGTKFKNVEKDTDENGIATVSAETTGCIEFDCKKPGYYETSGTPYVFIPKQVKDNKFQPWNPTWQLVMKKIVTPIPMYVMNVDSQIPTNTKPVGYDLIKGDWVAPYGKGTISDLIVTTSGQYKDGEHFNLTFTLTFSNKGDGIQSIIAPIRYTSQLALGYRAPLEGYQDKLEINQSCTIGDDGFDKEVNVKPKADRSFFFKVRTQLDKDGKPVKTMYGYILSDIFVGGYAGPKPQIQFSYYLNPDGTNNIEWDRKNNLAEPPDNP